LDEYSLIFPRKAGKKNITKMNEDIWISNTVVYMSTRSHPFNHCVLI
jgi:hypothetical protein